MKVSEVIQVLQTMPQDADVVVSFYEGGVNTVTRLIKCKIRKWKYGEIECFGTHYVIANEGEKGYTNSKTNAIWLK